MTIRRPPPDWDRTRAALVHVAFAWAVVASLFWLLAPVVETRSIGNGTNTSSTETLLQSEGPVVLLLLLVPVVITGVAVLAARSPRRRAVRLGTGGLLLVCCLLAAASIGLLYMPSAVLLLVAGFRTPPGPPRIAPAPDRDRP